MASLFDVRKSDAPVPETKVTEQTPDQTEPVVSHQITPTMCLGELDRLKAAFPLDIPVRVRLPDGACHNLVGVDVITNTGGFVTAIDLTASRRAEPLRPAHGRRPLIVQDVDAVASMPLLARYMLPGDADCDETSLPFSIAPCRIDDVTPCEAMALVLHLHLLWKYINRDHRQRVCTTALLVVHGKKAYVMTDNLACSWLAQSLSCDVDVYSTWLDTCQDGVVDVAGNVEIDGDDLTMAVRALIDHHQLPFSM